MGEIESRQGEWNLGMSHPENDRDSYFWSPLGLGFSLWKVRAYPRDMARLLAGKEIVSTEGPAPAPGPLPE